MTAAIVSERGSPPVPAPRIVGIGASAGGLAALESFLSAVPSHSGLAYVVVQHLDPTQKTLLAELLQRVTPMPVHEAGQGMRLEPDAVFVIPPDTELRVADGRLHLSRPGKRRGMRLPINILFSSLASAQGERAIAVLLSGMGSDGTPGMQAIKAVGGLTLVQDPGTAQFDAMPRSAIDAGCADIVAGPGDLPARLMAYVDRVPDQANESFSQEPESSAPLQPIMALLQRQTRHDFSLYKPSTLHRRVGRRMAIHDIASTEQYADYLARNPSEIDLLFKELLIGVTEFFRDAEAWRSLAEKALPTLLAARSTERELRAWCIGCSTGEEAYSLAMVFREVVGRLPVARGFKLQIFASDLNPDAIANARRGHFPLSISDRVSAERLARFFTRTETGYRIHEDIRDMVLFARHDVILDPPFTRLDLLLCRNLLIYFDPELQRKLLPLFHYCLRDAGVLMLGSSETVGRFDHLFTVIDARQRLYGRQSGAAHPGEILLHSMPPLFREPKENPVPPTKKSGSADDNLQAAADHVLLQVYAPAAVVLNQDGDIVYISGRTGKYLEPAAGKANWNFHAMARDGLRAPIAHALRQAGTSKEPVQLRALQVETPAGPQAVDVTVQALHTPSTLEGMTMVVFRDRMPRSVSDIAGHDGSLTAHEAELQQYRDEIVALREEARSTREQLQSANEELQSTNEELQSANEELTTSKEEMQSMNEELQIANSELQSRLDDLALAQSDMKNVLNNIEIAVLFLDRQLNVRRYTDHAARIISLREDDIGRPLSELTSILQYPELDEDARETLRTLQVSEKQVQTGDDRWFTVRIMPYHRIDDVIDGVVITMVDITEIRNLEQALRDESRR